MATKETNRWVAYKAWILDKGMIHVLGMRELNGERFHHATQNSAQFKTYELWAGLYVAWW